MPTDRFTGFPGATRPSEGPGLQGGSIMEGWTKDENVMIASCNDGTRPVIFKIERIDCEA